MSGWLSSLVKSCEVMSSHDVAWYCMVLHIIAWYHMVLHGIAWFFMLLHGIAFMSQCVE